MGPVLGKRDELEPRTKWPVLVALSLLLMAIMVACSNQGPPAVAAARPEPTLTELESIEQLQALFNEDTGKPRLLMILAPL
jgi:hypothetical protein